MSNTEFSPEIDLYIQRLKTHLRVRTDEELAVILGMSKQNIANWRRRRAIPARTAERMRKEFQLEFSEPPRRTKRAESAAAHAAGLLAVRDYLKTLDHEPSPAEWQRLGDSYIFLLEAIRGFLVAELPGDENNSDLVPKLLERNQRNVAALIRMMDDDFELPSDFPI